MQFDPLERRQLLSVATQQAGGTLTVTDNSSTNDTISFFQVGGSASSASINLSATGIAPAGFTGVSKIVVLHTGGGTDSITGGNSGSVVLVPMSITGGNAGDTLTGGSGNDTITGGNGNDLLSGGLGANLLNGGGGTNTVDYSRRTTGVVIDLNSNSNDSGTPGEGDTLLNIQNAIGGSGNDSIFGSAANNVIAGNGGVDTIIGNGGDDTITGNDGTNSLGGSGGNDLIFSQNGTTDTLNGGAGTNFANADPIDILNNIGANGAPVSNAVLGGGGLKITAQTASTSESLVPDPQVPDSTAGELDPTFAPTSTPSFDLRIQRLFSVGEGKTLAVGSSDGQITLVRYDANGRLDDTFGYGGVAVTPASVFPGDNLLGVTIDPQGRVIVVGENNPGEAIMLRFTADGSVDTTFGTDGVVTFDPGGTPFTGYTSIFYAATVVANGDIVAVGFVNQAGTAGTVVAAFNASGQLDTSFGGQAVGGTSAGPGYSTQALPSGEGGGQSTTILQRPNGDIVGIFGLGNGSSGNGDFDIEQFTPAGQLDTSFGTGGVSPIFTPGLIESSALEPDGSILVAGFTGFVERILADGSGLDTSFGTAGSVTVTGEVREPGALAVLGDGDIAVVSDDFLTLLSDAGVQVNQKPLINPAPSVLAVGPDQTIFVANVGEDFVGNPAFNVTEYAPGATGVVHTYGNNGTADPVLFPDGDDGAGTLSLSSTGLAQVVETRPDGTILVGVQEDYSNSTNSTVIYAQLLNPDGSIDTDFTSVPITIHETNVNLQTISLNRDGSFILGIDNPAANESGETNLYKFNADGTTDTTFGTGGEVKLDGYGYLGDVNVQPNGQIVVAEQGNVGQAGLGTSVLRLNADGSTDTTFGSGGLVTLADSTNFPNGLVMNAIAFDSAGDIVLGGNGATSGFDSQLVAVRLLPNGAIDTSFGNTNGFEETGLFGNVNAVAIDALGRIYLGGNNEGTVDPFYVLQLQPDGQIDSTDGFTANGTATEFSDASDSSINSLTIIDGTTLLAVGSSTSSTTGDTSVGLMEFSIVNGSLVSSFGGQDGATPGTTDQPYSIPAAPAGNHSVAVDDAGNIVVAAEGETDGVDEAYVARYLGESTGAAGVHDLDIGGDISNLATPQQIDQTLASLPAYLAPLFSSSATDGTLTLNGTPSPDNIALSYNSSVGEYIVDINGVEQSYDAYLIGAIVINGGNGNDTISVDSTIDVPVTISGGNGDDSISDAGTGGDLVNGDNGNDTLSTTTTGDTLLGGNGDDTFLNATGSDDSIDGGLGNNTAQANSADDLVNVTTSASTTVTTNPAAKTSAVVTNNASPAGSAGTTTPLTPLATPVYTVSNTNDTGPGSLRQAITTADTASGLSGGQSPLEILFEIPGASSSTPATITLASALPTVDANVYINGATQLNYANGVPAIVLDGSGITATQAGDDSPTPADADGLTLTGSDFLQGLSIVNFDGNGLVLSNSGSDTIVNNYIGLTPSGTAAPNSADGVFIDNTSGNVIENNVLSGNDGAGVELGNRNPDTGAPIPASAEATGNQVSSNIIGLDPTGTFILANGGDGILVDGAGMAIFGNVIAGNTGNGVNVINTNVVTSVTSTSVNQDTISGSAGDETISGNFIGTNAAGAQDLGNDHSGIALADDGGDLVGPDAGAGQGGNVIGGNGLDGIDITADSGNGADRIEQNQIGTDTAVDPNITDPGSLGNANNGISLLDSVVGVVIGGNNSDSAADGNTIVGNNGAGVLVGSGAVRNTIRFNSIDDNNALGIDLNAAATDDSTAGTDPASDSGDGVTENSGGDNSGSGGNDLIDYPTITTVSATDIVGTYDGVANTSVTLDFYSSPAADQSGMGEGRTYLFSKTLEIGSSGVVDFDATGAIPSNGYVTATATDSRSANTSEFSNAVAEPASLGTIQFSASGYTANTSTTGSSATIQITRTGSTAAAASVYFATSDGTATAGKDYTTTDQTVNFAVGQSSVNVTVPILAQDEYGPNKTVTLTLSDDSGASAGTPSTATLTIDDTVAEPSLSVANASVQDSGSATSLVFTVTLSAASQDTTTVQYATSNGTARAGTDYTATSGTLTITAGSTTGTVTVPVTGESEYQASKTLTLTLSNPSNATISNASATGTINYTATEPSLSVANASDNASSTTATSLTFTVTLSAASGYTTTVNYATSDGTAKAGTDYTATSGTLTIAAGSTSGTVTVPVSPEAANQANKTLTLTLSSPTEATISQGSATGTIVSPTATPSASVANASVQDSGSATSLVFTVTLSAASQSTTTLHYATSDGTAKAGTDYTATSGTLTITAGSTTGTVTVPVTGESEYQASKTLTLTLSNPSNATISNASATGTINYTAAEPSLSVANATDNASSTGPTSLTFTVTLSAASGYTTTVNYATSDGTAKAGTDYTATSGTLTITAGSTTGTVTVPVSPEAANQVNKTLTLTLSSPTDATISQATATGTIVSPTVRPSASVANTSVQDSGSATSLIFTVTLSAASQSTTTVQYATSNGTAKAGTDYTATSGTLTIAAGSTTGTVTVPVTGENEFQASKTLTLTLSNPSNATISNGSATGTITYTATEPSLSVANASDNASSTSATSLTFTVTLSAASGYTTTVNYATSDGTAKAGTDYTATSGTLTIAAGSTTGTVTVPVAAEAANQTNKTLTLTLSSPTEATISQSTATGTIVSPVAVAAPSVSIANASITDVTTGTTTLKFTLTRTGNTAGASSVLVSASPGTAKAGTDYVFSPTTVTFAAGQTTQTVSVTIEGHNDYFPDRTFSLTLSNPSHATIGTGTATGTIHSGVAQPAINVGAASVTAPVSGTTTVMVPVTLSQKDASSVTVSFKTVDGSAKAGVDYVGTSGTITFGADQTTVYVPVTIDKGTSANNLTFSVTVFGTPTGGAKIGVASGTVTIQPAPMANVYLGPDPLNVKLTALFVNGTATGDNIVVTAGPTPGSLTVTINGVNFGTYTPTGHLYVTAKSGAENIRIDKSVNTPAFLYGGVGNDTISAGSGRTVIEGNGGNDSLTAGSGRDILIGGTGSDTLAGGGDNDILIGGITAYDNNLFALNDLILEWARTDQPFNQRIAYETSGGGYADGAQLNLFTIASNPITPDVLIGGTASDVIFLDPFKYHGAGDVLKNINPSDVVIPL